MNPTNQKTLQDSFPKELAILVRLYPQFTRNDLDLMNKVFQVTEEKWEENIQRLQKNKAVVKYLLIGEAAPSIDEDTPTNQPISYFYNTNSGQWCAAIVRAILGYRGVYAPLEQKLDALAREGFLLVDSMPFAANYSKNNKRNSPHYANLVSHCVESYMMHKLRDARLSWHQDIRVCFGVRRNALCVMKGLDYRLTIGNTNIPLSEDQVGTNAAHYPDTQVIKSVFGIT